MYREDNTQYKVFSRRATILGGIKFTLIGLLLKLVSDLTYMWVDPRIDFERRQS